MISLINESKISIYNYLIFSKKFSSGWKFVLFYSVIMYITTYFHWSILQVDIVKVTEEPPMNNDSSQLDYRQTYAEFSRPPSLPNPVQKPCPECGNNVPENELQSHLDFHFALQLSQQQREEFRSEIKTKYVSPSTAKPKTVSSTLRAKPKAPLIDKFLTAANASNTSTDDVTTACSECGKLIPTANMPEHLDYHAARKLQIELNKLEMHTVKSNKFVSVVNKSGNVSNGGLKRKRPTSGDKSQPTRTNSLSSYFNKMWTQLTNESHVPC